MFIPSRDFMVRQATLTALAELQPVAIAQGPGVAARRLIGNFETDLGAAYYLAPTVRRNFREIDSRYGAGI